MRRLAVHSSAYALGPGGRAAQFRVGGHALAGAWRACSATLMELSVPSRWYRPLVVGLGASLMALRAPGDPSDMIATIKAEDRFDGRSFLGRIRAPALVGAGTDDAFHTPELFRATAAGSPDGRLVIQSGVGLPAKGGSFEREVRAFLRP